MTFFSDDHSDDYVRELEIRIQKFNNIIRHLRAKDHNLYFICGSVGKKDKNNLPENIFICPIDGLEGYAVYTKTKDYSKNPV